MRETEELRNLVTQLEEEQQMADRAPTRRLQLHGSIGTPSLSAIFGARVSGVEFEQVIIQPGRTVGLVGVAEDVDSMVSFRTQMRNVDNILELVSFNLTSASGSDNPTGGNPSDLSIAFQWPL